MSAALAACAPRPDPAPGPDRLSLSPVSFDQLPGWAAGNQAGALTALDRSCKRWLRHRPDAPSSGSVPDLRAGAFIPPCRALQRYLPQNDSAARAFFEEWFSPYRMAGNDGDEGLFTGYYEPEIEGSLTPGGRYMTPLLARPETKRLPDREAIEAGALGARAKPVAWVADPVDAFFLHIQGSGRIRLPDGSVLRLGFDGHNGHPYTSIGGVLIRRGALDREEVSMQTIRAWLAQNPAETASVLNSNARYVFFRVLSGPGPVGAEGVPLTPGRSLAIDRRLVPFGAPVWLETRDALDDSRPVRRLMVAQDTGGAIKGAVRGDIFFGAGPDAAARAGRMNRAGRYFLLLPRGFLKTS